MSAAVVHMQQNRLIRKFRTAGATTPATAKAPEDIACRQGWIFRRMAARNVFVHIGNGKFYLDEEAASELIQRRRATVLAVMAVVLMLFLFIWLVSHH